VSGASESRVETVKLGRLLGVDDPRALAFLLAVPAAELRDYRESVVDLLYDDNHEQLQRVADASRLLPARTLAAIGQHALGPLICARLSGLLDGRRAVEISDHFTVDFLAQVAAELDPRRAADVVAGITPDTVVAVSVAMAAHAEYVAMGRFVGYLNEATLGRCVEALGDEDLVRVAYVMEGDERLVAMFELVGPEHAARALSTARAAGLGQEADHVSARLHELGAGA
jgi:hypothetical protein